MHKIALVLHGWPQTSMIEHELVKFLKEKGFQVITPNLLDTNKSWNLTRVCRKVKKDIRNFTPGVIVGVSMGGLILPKLVKDYKNAKLIFIATAPSFKPDFKLMKLMSRLLEKSVIKNTMSFFYEKLSYQHLAGVYRKVNPFKGNLGQKKLYEVDLERNITAIRKYPFSKHLEILEALGKIDNTVLLSDIKNPAIIFGGREDSLMPLAEVRKLKKLLKGSKLYVTHGSHFNVFTKRNLGQLEDFIES